MPSPTHRLPPIALLLALPVLPVATAQAEAVDLSVGIASATVIRGLAVGEGGVDVHATASVAHPSGWRATLGATALHAPASQRRWDTQLFGRVGYAHRLGDDWSAQLALARYAYPGSTLLRRYGHDELGGTLAFRDLLYLSVAGLRRTHYTGEGRHSVAWDVVARHALPAGLVASAGLGRLEPTSGPAPAYAYGHLGLGTQWGAAQAQLAYIATDSAAKRRFGDAAANRWTASLGWSF